MPNSTSSTRILVTGASGLIGSFLTGTLRHQGYAVNKLDISAERPSERGDIRDADRVRVALKDCDGIVHLAAVSRVITGQRNPEQCWATNVVGLQTVLNEAWIADRRPWVIFASSREVYGQPEKLPADEDCPLGPVNVYGDSKVEGEKLIEEARNRGQRANVIRLSNVFGSVNDHEDRVIPAFARAAMAGQPLRVDGDTHTFDFTHISDVARGISTLARLLLDGHPPPPPIHFVSGKATTLGELASLAITITRSSSAIRLAAPRDYDVARFVGNGARAKALLGWESRVSLQVGLERLIADFRANNDVNTHLETHA